MEQQQFRESSEEGLFEESINLRHYWHIILERRWLVAATFAVVMVLCLFYLFTVTSIFSAPSAPDASRRSPSLEAEEPSR